MLKRLKKFAFAILGISILAAQVGCASSTLTMKNDQWEVVIVSANNVFQWHNIKNTNSGDQLLVMELKFHRLDSPQNTTVDLRDLSLLGWKDFDKRILAISKDSATHLTISGLDASMLEFLFCGDSGCSYSVSAEAGLPDDSSLAQINDAVKVMQKERNPLITLEASGDTLYVTLGFDYRGGYEDLVFKFRDLPPITFTVK